MVFEFLMEHKTRDRKSGVVVHAWDEGHRVDWEGTKILESEPYYLKRRILEAIWIRKISRNSNLGCGFATRVGSHTFWNEHISFLPSLLSIILSQYINSLGVFIQSWS